MTAAIRGSTPTGGGQQPASQQSSTSPAGNVVFDALLAAMLGGSGSPVPSTPLDVLDGSSKSKGKVAGAAGAGGSKSAKTASTGLASAMTLGLPRASVKGKHVSKSQLGESDGKLNPALDAKLGSPKSEGSLLVNGRQAAPAKLKATEAAFLQSGDKSTESLAKSNTALSGANVKQAVSMDAHALHGSNSKIPIPTADLPHAIHDVRKEPGTDSNQNGVASLALSVSGNAMAIGQMSGTPGTESAPAGTATLNLQQPDGLAQFGQLLSVKVNEGQTQLQVQIVPQGLGQLNLTITKGPDGIQIQVMANQESTFQLLNQQLPTLQQAVQDAGVNLASMQLSYGQTGGQQSQQQQDRQQRQSTGKRISTASDTGTYLGVDGIAAERGISSHQGNISLSV